MSLQMYYHSKGVYHKFMQDADFADVWNCIDNCMKHLSRIGKVSHREKAEPFSLSEEEYMWSQGILGTD